MSPKKIIFFDIDHTLFDPVTQAIPSDTINAMKTLHKRDDIYLAIATGRAHYMLDVIKPIMPYIDTYITINGQIVNHKGKIIHDEPMNLTTIKTIQERFEHYGLTYGYIGKEKQAVSFYDAAVEAMFLKSTIPLPLVNKDFYKENAVYQMWAFADEAKLKALSVAFNDLNFVPWLSDGFDIIHSNMTKLDGIKLVLSKLNISINNAYCFGDGMNDLEMIEGVPNSVAMGNAVEEIKQAAAFVTKPCDAGGIVHALKHYKLLDE